MNKRCMLVMSHRACAPQKQQGSAIIIAIFIIIIISLLGAALGSLQRDSAQGTSYEVYAARAYLSAYSAGEVALVNLFPLGDSEVDDSNCSTASTDVTLDANDVGFHGCKASYQCYIITPNNTGSLATRYKIVSTAVCENTQIVTRRQITVEAASL